MSEFYISWPLLIRSLMTAGGLSLHHSPLPISLFAHSTSPYRRLFLLLPRLSCLFARPAWKYSNLPLFIPHTLLHPALPRVPSSASLSCFCSFLNFLLSHAAARFSLSLFLSLPHSFCFPLVVRLCPSSNHMSRLNDGCLRLNWQLRSDSFSLCHGVK